ncbi:hypothetical protein WD019_02210 [Fictibacillus sp. Mic-4]|uniref:hypothetical protein n=1 Tax=Fictibacillus sp. Mic-4 TaxID=3132826 RepID=UPI003CEFAC61
MSKITDFKTVKGGKNDEIANPAAEALNGVLSNLSVLIQYQHARAEIKRNYYEHLIKHGFSENEALEIVKSDTTI